MDCCKTKKENKCCKDLKNLNEKQKSGNMKGGSVLKMDKKMLMWIIIGILFLAVLFLTFKTNSISVQSAGTIAKAAASSASSGSQMVGGC